METLTFSFADLMTWVANQTGSTVNLEDLCGITREIPLLRLRAEQYYHHGPYCEFAKLHGNQARCAANKLRTVRRARAGRPFASVCPQGVWDWVQPVVWRDELLGVLYLGSLRAGASLRPAHGRAYHGPSLPAATPAVAQAMRRHAQFLHDAMMLIIGQWVDSGHRLSKQKPQEFYAQMTQLFIQNHYHEPVRVEDLAQQLKMHPYYLGKIVRRACGRNFRALLMEHRIGKAKVMLLTGQHTVTETAYACGFNDSNYFSTAFRRITGLSPRQFLKSSA